MATFEEEPFGFKYGPVTVERQCSDDKKGWVFMTLKTRRGEIGIYVTKTGFVDIMDEDGNPIAKRAL